MYSTDIYTLENGQLHLYAGRELEIIPAISDYLILNDNLAYEVVSRTFDLRNNQTLIRLIVTAVETGTP